MKRVVRGGVAACVLAMALPMTAQQAAWTVKPEWVKAHEEFLASDVMAGRGSATRDEQIAATYVASEFEGYGLQHAPGMSSYLQMATLISPRLDGHATLSAGSVSVSEGKDFDLLVYGGSDLSGKLVRVPITELKTTKFERGSIVLVTGVAGDPGKGFGAYTAARRAGAAAVLLQGEGVEGLYGVLGSQTKVGMHLEGVKPERAQAAALALKSAALDGVAAGTVVTLSAKEMAPAKMETFNAIGYLPGSDPKAGTILLTAHLDHLGTGKPVNGDAIYNGANDDAAGTTAVMEFAHALAAGPKLRRSVLFVCYGSEEMGEYGSLYFGAHSPVPLKDLVANIEFEMIGNQDPKTPKGTLLFTGYDRSNLGLTLKEHGALVGPDPYPEQHFFERSDNYQLALKGVVAHTAAGWGTVPTYHQPNDDIAHLDLPFMTAAIQSFVEPIRWLATSDFVPKWNPGGDPSKEK
ncbi:M28 family peptidase [Granulicella cerasi]|uniref:M28 family peptidase n=1 Tax=Granulicella cerasi TaxID=741063 RepID=A0ABW1ZCR2_9BACT|nr:M28 family peptidase [Granulicella cerasi]